MKKSYVLRVRVRNGRKIIEKRYGMDLTCKKCGKTYFTNNTTIKKRKQLSYCQKCINSGSTHGRWKSGKLMRDGYILLWMPSHPNCDKYGYMKEHRVVMETYLGRYLSGIEVIHHKDGNRANNKISNLKLFKDRAAHSKFHLDEAWRSRK